MGTCLTERMLNDLKCVGIPMVFFKILAWLHANSPPLSEGEAVFDVVEFFSGACVIQSCAHAHKLCAGAFDIEISQIWQDLCSPRGFITALLMLVGRCKRNGRALCTFAPPCNSWVWLSRGKTLRSPACPEGNTLNYNVRMANCLAARVGLLIALCYAMNIDWILEQPASSLFMVFEVLQHVHDLALERSLGWYRCRTYQGCYGLHVIVLQNYSRNDNNFSKTYTLCKERRRGGETHQPLVVASLGPWPPATKTPARHLHRWQRAYRGNLWRRICEGTTGLEADG